MQETTSDPVNLILLKNERLQLKGVTRNQQVFLGMLKTTTCHTVQCAVQYPMILCHNNGKTVKYSICTVLESPQRRNKRRLQHCKESQQAHTATAPFPFPRAAAFVVLYGTPVANQSAWPGSSCLSLWIRAS